MTPPDSLNRTGGMGLGLERDGILWEVGSGQIKKRESNRKQGFLQRGEVTKGN